MLELRDNSSVATFAHCNSFAARQWKILLKLKSADRATMWGEMVFTILKTNDAQCGTGDMFWTQGGRVSPAVRTDVEGLVVATTARLQLYMLERPIGHSPFICEGEAITPDLHYSGTWHANCLDPVGCACGGSSGDFTFVKLG